MDIIKSYVSFPIRKCYIVAAGPSLAFIDLSPIHTDKDLVISINSSIRLMPWLDHSDVVRNRIWFSTDLLCTKWDYYKNYVLPASCTRIVRDNWTSIKELPVEKFSFFKAHEKGENDGLFSQSSTTAALHFALLIGCKQIVLFGCDQRFLHSCSHYWQLMYEKLDRPYRLDKGKNFFPCQRQQVKVFNYNVQIFDKLNALAKDLNVGIYNCSHISALKIFPKISLNDAIKL